MTGEEFWWNWWVQVAAALGTLAAVLVALFGHVFRARLFSPLLALEIADLDGEFTTSHFQDGRVEPVRYYHVRVTNGRRWSPATGVQIVLLQVEERGPNERFQVAWRGDIPFGWRHQVIFPVQRTIGSEAYIDLCSVGAGGLLQLHLLIAPFNLPVIRQGKQTLILTIQARATEADSPPLRIQLAWDGRWEAGVAEMRRHLILERLVENSKVAP